MQMVVQRQAQQPVQVWLRGVISAEDVQILEEQARQWLEQEHAVALWVHLEQVHHLADEAYAALARVLQDFALSETPLVLVVSQKELFRRLQSQGLPVQLHDPDPILEKATVF